MKADDFLITIPPSADGLWPVATQVPRTELFEQLRQGPLPGVPDLDAGVALTKLVHRELEGRGGSLEITAVGRKIAIPGTEAERRAALQEAFANTVFDG